MLVTVVWLDGKKECYPCSSYRVKDGVLYLERNPGAPNPVIGIPLCNVRSWTE